MAFTTIPVAGSKLRGSVLSDLITEVRPLLTRKTSNETVNNSTTLQNDDDLVIAVEADAVYECHLHCVFTSSTGADFKVAFTAPTGATTPLWTYWLAGGNVNDWTPTGGLTGIAGSGASEIVESRGLLVMSSTAGSFQFQWAQNALEVSNTIVHAGSYLSLKRVS